DSPEEHDRRHRLLPGRGRLVRVVPERLEDLPRPYEHRDGVQPPLAIEGLRARRFGAFNHLYAATRLRRRLAGKSSRRNCPAAHASASPTPPGGPPAIPPPPASPPSGPRSTIQSACLITSRLCSITSTVLPASTSRWSTSRSFSMSAKCRPVVGSSRMYSVRPVATFDSSDDSFTRCASPPDSVVAGCPSLM